MNSNEQAAQLKTIAEMLQRTRYNIRINSIFYLIWGWLVLLSVLIEYILLTYSIQLTLSFYGLDNQYASCRC